MWVLLALLHFLAKNKPKAWAYFLLAQNLQDRSEGCSSCSCMLPVCFLTFPFVVFPVARLLSDIWCCGSFKTTFAHRPYESKLSNSEMSLEEL